MAVVAQHYAGRMRYLALPPITVVLALAAAPPPAGAATSAQSSIRFAWSQQITYAGVGDARACRYMNEAYSGS